jgi:ribosome maturation factor RimP
MNTEQKTEQIGTLLESLLAEMPGAFPVEIRLKPGNKIQILLDADQGLALSQCVSCNRALYKLIEESALFPEGDFELEVSSPGLDEPLRLTRQYIKNIGRPVEVLLTDGRKFAGKLLSANETQIEIEETKGKGKKQEIINHTFLTDQIKYTKIQIVF